MDGPDARALLEDAEGSGAVTPNPGKRIPPPGCGTWSTSGPASGS